MPTTTVQKGIRTKVNIVSKTHGRKEVPMVQGFSITPNLESESVGEFGSEKPVLSINSFTDADVSFDYLQSDNTIIEAMIMDTDPTQTIQYLDISNARPVQLFLNHINHTTGKIYAGVVVQQAVISGYPFTEGLKENASYSVTFKTAFAHIIQGAAILYTRGVPSGFTGFTTPDDKTFDVSNQITLDQPAASFQLAGGTTTKNYVLVLKNGEPVTTGFTISGSTVTLDAAPAATDVWEFFTVYTT